MSMAAALTETKKGTKREQKKQKLANCCCELLYCLAFNNSLPIQSMHHMYIPTRGIQMALKSTNFVESLTRHRLTRH